MLQWRSSKQSQHCTFKTRHILELSKTASSLLSQKSANHSLTSLLFAFYLGGDSVFWIGWWANFQNFFVLPLGRTRTLVWLLLISLLICHCFDWSFCYPWSLLHCRSLVGLINSRSISLTSCCKKWLFLQQIKFWQTYGLIFFYFGWMVGSVFLPRLHQIIMIIMLCHVGPETKVKS